MTKTYDSSKIKNLQFPESIRAKPSLYVGELGNDALFHLFKESVENVVDEALAGHATECIIQIGADQTMTVYDNGRGIPYGTTQIADQLSGGHASIPTLKAIVAFTHTSGKFDSDSYEVSRGTHGLGIKCNNALSDTFEVWTSHKDNEKIWEYVKYEKGHAKEHKLGKKPPADPVSNQVPKKGTVMRWTPDLKLLGATKVSIADIANWLTMASYFTEGLKFVAVLPNGKSKTFVSENGVQDYLTDRIAKLKCELISPTVFTYKDPLVDCAFQFTNVDGCEVQAFTNGLLNPERGLHFNSMYAALYTALTPYIKKRQEFSPSDLREGMIGLVNIKLSGPKFSSQNKTKLVDERAGKPLGEILLKAFVAFFAKHKKLAEIVCGRAFELNQLKTQFKASKASMTKIKKAIGRGLPLGAATSPNCKPEEREVFLVEGASAGGSAKVAREAYYQEVLPLRGKVKNVLKDKGEEGLTSDQVMNALSMIGFDPGKADPLSRLRVSKIINLSDPDPDGPLVGNTEVLVKINEEWEVKTMRELLSIRTSFKVITWTGTLFKTAEAFASYEGDTAEIYRVKIGHLHYDCTPKHKWPVMHKGVQTIIEAQDLKTGYEVIMHPAYAEGGEVNTAKLANVKTPALGHISSVKRKKMNVWVGCLTVPTHHNFMLASGVMTGNCHINTLLLGLFYKFLPQLYERGLVYVVDSPEYYEIVGTEVITGATADIVQEKLTKRKLKGRPHHIKGWGEVSPDVLAKLAFDPSTRKLIKIKAVETEHGVEFVKLMGTSVEARKLLLGIE